MKRCASITVKEWLEFQWKKAQKLVFSLQKRIAEATKQKRYNKVKVLQRLLTKSLSAKMLAVKQVTQNKGKRTAGIDKVIWRTAEQKAKAVGSLNVVRYNPQPLRRIHIPKRNGKTRPLGIPTMKDRAMQALFKMALEPISETLADSCSHGFRKHRSCHDAIASCFQILCRKNSPQCILEADITGCYDNIAHQWMLKNTPMNTKILEKWLKCGVVEKNKLFPTTAGTPQGGIISPILANMTLDGLQQHIYNTLNVKFSPKNRAYNNKFQVHLIRYADDFVVTANNPQVLEDIIKPAIQDFLKIRGLELSEEKTKISEINKGFDFLGFNIRKYKGKLLIKPSKSSVKDVKTKISENTKRLYSAKVDDFIAAINASLRGWGYNVRTVVSKEIFNKIDEHVFSRTVRWTKRRHPRKQWNWIRKKYYKTVERDNWVFSGKKLQIFKLSKIQIRRHIKIVGNANPFIDVEYFQKRKSRKTYSACANTI